MLSNESKLAELRARTDQDLVRYVKSQLALGIRLASAGDPRAGQLFAAVAALLPLIENLDVRDRRQLKAGLHHLRGMLKQRPVLVQAAV